MSENNNNVYVDFYLKPGTFYNASKEPKDGYEKITYGKDDDPKTTYHKLVESVEGTLVGMVVSKHPTIGDQVKIYLEQPDDEVHVIVFPLYNRFSDISGWADSFARMVGNLQKKEDYIFYTNTDRVDDSGRPYEGFVIREKASGEEIRWTVSNDDVPKLEKKEDRAGNIKYNGDARTDFLLDLLFKKVKRKDRNTSNSGGGQNSERANPPAERAKPETTSSGREVEEAEVVSETKNAPKDDLPF